MQLEGLSKHFAGRAVIHQVSLQAREGELLTLVGPSGSGKSTLLRLISGLAEPDAGSIHVAGRDVGRLPPEQRDIAMVFQSYALFPHLTIADNLSFGMRARREPQAHIAARGTEVAEVLGLQPMLTRTPRQLSGGERQRVALGRAMLREPKLFLLDEPLSNLDAQLRVQTRAEILRLHGRLGTTMVYVTHDQVEALSLGQRVGVLRDGRLEDLGEPERIYRRPRTLFVARFVGSPPMNTVAVAAAPPDRVTWGSQSLPVPRLLAQHLGAAGRRLVLGVRPEHVQIQGSRWARGETSGQALAATVQSLEYAGDQVTLELLVQGASLLARVEPEYRALPGQGVTLCLDPEDLLLFDADSELALGAPEAGA
ncbi:MAG: ABC transporter ATP-binding protein [Ideonella sp.]|nr:ABC transporter ATP-binding protein [Ideonella sp.]